MEQGNRLDSTPVSACQSDNGRGNNEPALDAAVTRLLTQTSEAPEPTVISPELAAQFHAAHTAWQAAVKANLLPTARYKQSLQVHLQRGLPGRVAAEAAWALPGVADAAKAEEDSFITVSDLALEIKARPVTCLDDLALVAKAATVLIWTNGRFEMDAALGEDENLDEIAARVLINACVDLAGAPARDQSANLSDAPNDAAVFRAIDAHREIHNSFGDAAAAADKVAIRQHGGDTSDAALAPLKAAEIAASDAEEQAWRDLFKVRPETLFGLLRLLRHSAEHYDSNIGMDDAPDVFGALIGAVEGLRFASHPRPADYDLSRLSIAELEQLARITSRERETLMAIESQGFCWGDKRRDYSPIGKIVHDECERMGFLGDYAFHEIERRRPTDKDDITLRLEALVRHHLNTNGYIEPELMAEVIQAWGRA